MLGLTRTGANNPRPQGNNNPLSGTHPTGTSGQANNNVVCYECGQAGHIKPNCPRLRDRQRVAGARIGEILEDTGEPSPDPPVINDDSPQVDTGPPERDGEERVAIADWASQSSQYHWDDFEDQRSSIYRSNAVTHVTESYMERRQYYTTAPSIVFHASAGAIDKTVEPLYDHRAR